MPVPSRKYNNQEMTLWWMMMTPTKGLSHKWKETEKIILFFEIACAANAFNVNEIIHFKKQNTIG